MKYFFLMFTYFIYKSHESTALKSVEVEAENRNTPLPLQKDSTTRTPVRFLFQEGSETDIEDFDSHESSQSNQNTPEQRWKPIDELPNLKAIRALVLNGSIFNNGSPENPSSPPFNCPKSVPLATKKTATTQTAFASCAENVIPVEAFPVLNSDVESSCIDEKYSHSPNNNASRNLNTPSPPISANPTFIIHQHFHSNTLSPAASTEHISVSSSSKPSPTTSAANSQPGSPSPTKDKCKPFGSKPRSAFSRYKPKRVQANVNTKNKRKRSLKEEFAGSSSVASEASSPASIVSDESSSTGSTPVSDNDDIPIQIPISIPATNIKQYYHEPEIGEEDKQQEEEPLLEDEEETEYYEETEQLKAILEQMQFILLMVAGITFCCIVIYAIYYVNMIKKIYSKKERVSK